MMRRAVDRRGLQDFARRHPAHGQTPHLPVVAEPLQLAVTTDADQSTGALNLGCACRDLREDELVVAHPA